jgi:hypothetical protein
VVEEYTGASAALAVNIANVWALKVGQTANTPGVSWCDDETLLSPCQCDQDNGPSWKILLHISYIVFAALRMQQVAAG